MMKNTCVVGSLSGIFTHCYIVGLINTGHKVCIINTSKRINYDKYLDCSVLNLYPKKNEQINDKTKSNLKKNFLFCYFYELLLFFRSIFSHNADIEFFLKEKDINTFVFFGGTSIRREFYCIKNIFKNIKDKPEFILDVATYPIRDYATENTPGSLLFFDTKFFNEFDIVLSHSSYMDSFLQTKLSVDSYRINRFVCSFPNSAYFKGVIESSETTPKKIIFLGTLDKSSSINDITNDIIKLADTGIDVYVQENKDYVNKNPRIKTFKPFSFEQIINGEFSNFCSTFDGALVVYGPMSPLREKLTYPTRYALALLQNIPIFIPKKRFKSLEEIAGGNKNNQIIYYSSIDEIATTILSFPGSLYRVDESMEIKLNDLLVRKDQC